MESQLQWGNSQRTRCLCHHLQSTGHRNSSTKAEFCRELHLKILRTRVASLVWGAASVEEHLLTGFQGSVVCLFSEAAHFHLLSGFNIQPVLHCWTESAPVPGIFFLWTGTNKLELDHSSLIFYKLDEVRRWTNDVPLNPVPLLFILSHFL